MAHKNGDYSFRARALHVARGWLHLMACDFAGVLTICESAVPLVRDSGLRAGGRAPHFRFPGLSSSAWFCEVWRRQLWDNSIVRVITSSRQGTTWIAGER